MTVDELLLRSSVQLFQAHSKMLKPEGSGTGCLVKYKEQTLLLTVSHVTNDDGLSTYIETNIPMIGVECLFFRSAGQFGIIL